jgi:type II secretory pathway pseudopilin PulG
VTARAASNLQVRAFTIIELLVTVAIIILLLGLLLVGLQQAARAAQVAQTKTLMSSINRALVSFKTDVGYYPPVLGRGSGNGSQPVGQLGFGRDLLVPPLSLTGTTSNLALQQWNSFTSLPEYLLGYGSRTADGYGVVVPWDPTQPKPSGLMAQQPGKFEEPRTGIRHPGRDGVWGAVVTPRTGQSAGSFGARNVQGVSQPDGTSAVFRGKALGPYLELKDAVFLGGITDFNTTTGEPTIVRATEDPNFDALPKCIVDYWGRPIRYYRRPYTVPDCASVATGFTCGDFFALRPQSFEQGTDVDGIADGGGDTSTSRSLQSAEFALLSYGPDKSWDPNVRVDAQGYNKDNIVEAGP